MARTTPRKTKRGARKQTEEDDKHDRDEEDEVQEGGVGSNPSKKRKDDSGSPEMNNTESNEVDGSRGIAETPVALTGDQMDVDDERKSTDDVNSVKSNKEDPAMRDEQNDAPEDETKHDDVPVATSATGDGNPTRHDEQNDAPKDETKHASPGSIEHPVTPSRSNNSDSLQPNASGSVNATTPIRKLDPAMDYINGICCKGSLFFHAAYMAAFTGCYLGLDGTYRARIAPVNHNATNDFAVIAEITLNYSGSDIPRLKEREHLPEARLDLRSFFYATSGNDDVRFELQTLAIDREAEQSLAYLYPNNSDENWVEDLLNDGWRELLVQNPLQEDVQNLLADKLNVSDVWRAKYQTFSDREEYKQHRKNDGDGDVYRSWIFVEFMKIIGPLFPFRLSPVEGKHGGCAIISACYGLAFDEDTGVIRDDSILSYEYFRKMRLIHPIDVVGDFREELDKVLTGEKTLDIWRMDCRTDYRFVPGGCSLRVEQINTLFENFRTWSYHIAWNKLNSNKPYMTDLIAKEVIRNVIDRLDYDNMNNRPAFDKSIKWPLTKHLAAKDIRAGKSFDENNEVKSMEGLSLMAEGTQTRNCILSYCGNPHAIDREEELLNMLSAGSVGNSEFVMRPPYVSSLRSLLIDGETDATDAMTTSTANKLWLLPKIVLYMLSEVKGVKFEELYDTQHLKDLSHIAIMYYLNASYGESQYCDIHGGMSIWHGQYFLSRDTKFSFTNPNHLIIIAACVVTNLIDSALDDPNEYIWRDGGEQIDTREPGVGRTAQNKLDFIKSSLVNLQKAMVSLGRHLPDGNDALRNICLLGITVRTFPYKLHKIGMIDATLDPYAHPNRCGPDVYRIIIHRNLMRDLSHILATVGIDPDLKSWDDIECDNIASKSVYALYDAVSVSGVGTILHESTTVIAESAMEDIKKALPRSLHSEICWKQLTNKKYKIASVPYMVLLWMYVIKPYIPSDTRADRGKRNKKLQHDLFNGGSLVKFSRNGKINSLDKIMMGHKPTSSVSNDPITVRKLGCFRGVGTSAKNFLVENVPLNMKTVCALLVREIDFHGVFKGFDCVREASYEGNSNPIFNLAIRKPKESNGTEEGKTEGDKNNAPKFDRQDVKIRATELIQGILDCNEDAQQRLKDRMLNLTRAAGLGTYEDLISARDDLQSEMKLPRDFDHNDIKICLEKIYNSSMNNVKKDVLNVVSVTTTLSYTDYVVTVEQESGLGDLQDHFMMEIAYPTYNALVQWVLQNQKPTRFEHVNSDWFKKLYDALKKIISNDEWVCTLGNKQQVHTSTRVYIASTDLLQHIQTSPNPYETREKKKQNNMMDDNY